ncbi:endolytic transglycosylase MltG [Oceanirhabdus sp. W0125-5]|uniref:endolytic transglycosylase MltG n=1 Tax=Oceanirhabdus sp. W0125-5 TaxID=2999116 RepID=UPI0022F32422|nr:endolytic transglycosylase MltG [Oceanirhabdus sp. W0125-5]WBW99614.1 endolytic transglycosylase MltG [Oceanirhabdus sp. W0125-5]
MKKFLVFIIVLGAIITGGYLFGMNYYNEALNHPLTGTDNMKITVNQGDSFYSLLERLYNEKKVKNPLVYKLYVKKNNIKCDIKPGDYTINTDETFDGLISKLSEGTKKDTYRITIIEGMNIEQIADVFQKSGVLTRDDFLKAVQEYKLPEYVIESSYANYKLEGYLYPDTYDFYVDSKPSEVIEIMINKFEKTIESIEEEYSMKIENLHEVITLASIVEKEAVKDEERALISSVYSNRIKAGMLLQSCPTVIYSIGNEFYERDKLIVLNKDLKVESPYNTYMNEGLPPGPIGAPRKESILAALYPEDTNYLYFVSNNDGTHFFTDDYNDFLRVKAQTQGN